MYKTPFTMYKTPFTMYEKTTYKKLFVYLRISTTESKNCSK